MIRHTVAFTLKHAAGSAAERAFLVDAQVLATIPTVRHFECLRQVGQKTGHTFGFSMEFDTQQGYDAYNLHPVHVQFVDTRWKPEVAAFIELDYVAFEPV